MTARPARRAKSIQKNENFAKTSRVLSPVHTLGITRPGTVEDPWLTAIGEATKPHRLQKARKLDARAAELERAARLGGESDERAKDAGRWHRARAKGQRRRIETVRGCRKERAIRVECGSCGQFGEQEGRCGVGLLCVSCRGKRARKKRGNFARSREVVLRRAMKLGLMRRNRPGGRWSEKLVTLTGPHRDDVDTENRIEIMRAAWPHFIRKIKNSWLRASRGAAEAETVAWFRNFEWEPSSDGRGHPHIHVWMFCPYTFDRETLKQWWRESLIAAGYLDHEVRTLVTDVREAYSNTANEVIKYLTKDITRDGTRIDPILYAKVVTMLDGARTTQSSRGFMGLAGEYKPMCDCGCSRLVVRVIDLVSVQEHSKPSSTSTRAPP